MITNCRHKITEYKKTDRGPKSKCKRLGYVIYCVGEGNCDYVKDENRNIKEQQ